MFTFLSEVDIAPSLELTARPVAKPAAFDPLMIKIIVVVGVLLLIVAISNAIADKRKGKPVAPWIWFYVIVMGFFCFGIWGMHWIEVRPRKPLLPMEFGIPLILLTISSVIMTYVFSQRREKERLLRFSPTQWLPGVPFETRALKNRTHAFVKPLPGKPWPWRMCLSDIALPFVFLGAMVPGNVFFKFIAFFGAAIALSSIARRNEIRCMREYFGIKGSPESEFPPELDRRG